MLKVAKKTGVILSRFNFSSPSKSFNQHKSFKISVYQKNVMENKSSFT